VVIGYEMRDTNCGVCAAGTATIQPGVPASITTCAGYIDMCIWIISIGGCAPVDGPGQVNHLSGSGGCHSIYYTSYSGKAPCCGNVLFTAMWSNPNFTIQ
jgi:hypothetical protein